MPDGFSIPGGPSFFGFPKPADVPCDPTGKGWRGPPGPAGPQGPPGPGGPFLPIAGGSLTGNLKIDSVTAPGNNCEFEINGYSGNTIPLSGSQIWQGVWAHNQISGTSTSRINAYQFSTLASNFNNGAAGHYNLVGNITVTGGGGGYTGVEGHVNVAGGTGITFIVGTECSSEANVNVGGTAGTPQGYLAGAYAQATLWPGATFWNHLVGMETDVVMGVGASVQDITGHAIIWACDHNGILNLDAGISFARAINTSGWNYGISLCAANESPPFAPTATLIGCGPNVQLPATVSAGFDGSAFTFTTGFLKSKGFLVDGAGHVTSTMLTTDAIDTPPEGLTIGRDAKARLGFWGKTPIARPTVTGQRGSVATVRSLLAALAELGLVEDGTH